MRVSEITAQQVAAYIRLDEDDPVIDDPAGLAPIMKAAKQYIIDYTGLAEEDMDSHEDFYIAFMALCQDMYDNRTMYAEKGNVNRVIDSILSRHCVNFV